MSNFINRLKNMLNAIAYAEAGDLDAVKEILQRRYDCTPEAAVEHEEMAHHSALPAL